MRVPQCSASTALTESLGRSLLPGSVLQEWARFLDATWTRALPKSEESPAAQLESNL